MVKHKVCIKSQNGVLTKKLKRGRKGEIGNRERRGIRGAGQVWGKHGFKGYVHKKTQGLYQVTSWSYGQNTFKTGKGVKLVGM